MSYTASYGFGPGMTPRIIRQLIFITFAISIFCAFVNTLFLFYLKVQSPQMLLSLSWAGMQQGYIWQPISYMFIQSSGSEGISLSFFFELCFNMYVLWIMGTNITERVGSSPFISLYLFCGLCAGLATLFTMPLLGQFTMLAGQTAPILAIFTVWTMLHPEDELQFFFLIPIKAKWLLTAFVAALVLSNASHLNFIYVAWYLYSVLFAYLYATIAWGLESPFRWTYGADRIFNTLGSKVRSRFSSKSSEKLSADTKTKIIDFQTGKTLLDDDNFMDSALDKISKFGEKSLTWNERNRMKKISERKAREKEAEEE